MFRPMLASKIDDMSKIVYPVFASPKLDGIRCLLIDGVAVSRSLKPIPNKFIRKHIERTKLEGLDGEIIIKDKTFSEISSAVMSEEGQPDFSFVTFDYIGVSQTLPYVVRLNAVKEKVKKFPFIGVIRNTMINNEEELLALEQKFIAEGYEGLMFRKIDGPYKQGRSTVKEGYLIKVKRFEDAEAEVIGFEELMHNENDQEKDELGYSKRSSHQDNLIGSDTLGALIVKSADGIEFKIGTGFTHALRKELWLHKDKLVGSLVKYKFQPAGVKEKPRFPVWLAMRDRRDI